MSDGEKHYGFEDGIDENYLSYHYEENCVLAIGIRLRNKAEFTLRLPDDTIRDIIEFRKKHIKNIKSC